MLGSIKSEQTWKWAICGKHPVARDYFKSGSDDALLMAFSDWLNKGFHLLKDKRRHPNCMVSWRFWAKGLKKNEIVCGVGKDSSDQIGRPYPILIAGIGTLDGWQKHWELLPFALEKTLNQMEYLCVKRYNNFKHLEEGIEAIRSPEPLWNEYAHYEKQCRESLYAHGVGSWDISEFRNKILELSKQPILRASMEMDLSKDKSTLFGLWHICMKETLNNIPNAVFMGEIEKRLYLSVFMKALLPGDFVTLWSNSGQA